MGRPGQQQLWLPAMLLMPTAVTAGCAWAAHRYPLWAVAAALCWAAWRLYSRRPPAKIEGAPTVAIVGFGFSGLDMAIKLKLRGVPFVVFEKSPTTGGVWWDNRYPGVACDVFSHVYSLSYEPNPDWSKSFAEGAEIRQYMERVARKYGVLENVRFGHEMMRAEWDAKGRSWQLELRGPGGEKVQHAADVLLPAVGLFHAPRWPTGIGLDSFKGEKLHTRAWDSGFDATGKTVAVMGTGASAVQAIPRLAEKAKHLYVFQRTPTWIVPKQDFDYPAWVQAIFRYFPPFRLLHRYLLFANMELFSHFAFNTESQSRAVPRMLLSGFRRMMRSQTAALPRETAAALIPDYYLGCKRLVVSSEYLSVYKRSNVTLVPRPVAAVERRAVLTADPAEKYEVDALVCATGFDMLHHPAAERVIGVGGKQLSSLYGQRPLLYLAMAAHGFPNLFVLFGPGALVPPSGIATIERQSNYVLCILRGMAERSLAAVELTEPAGSRYFDESQQRLQRTILATCVSYYRTAAGIIWTHTPGGTLENWWIHRRPEWAHFQCTPRRGPSVAGSAD